jgi:hypothetical protein
MGVLSTEEHDVLSHVNANAALEQALSLLKTDKEALRAGHWNRLNEKDRKMICHMAGISAKKGACSLRDLDALERGKVNREAARMIRMLEIVIRCAQGGEMPREWVRAQ